MELLTYERIKGRQKGWKHKFKLRKHTFEFAVHIKCQNQKCSFYKHIFVNETTEIWAVRSTGHAVCVKLARVKKAADLIICRRIDAELEAGNKWNCCGTFVAHYLL